MDPNATLAQIRELIAAIFAGNTSADDIRELAKLTASLDEWIIAGGFLPRAWEFGRHDTAERSS